jgi:hypothetical protein
MKRDNAGLRICGGTRLIKRHVPVPTQPEDDHAKPTQTLQSPVKFSTRELGFSYFCGQAEDARCVNP